MMQFVLKQNGENFSWGVEEGGPSTVIFEKSRLKVRSLLYKAVLIFFFFYKKCLLLFLYPSKIKVKISVRFYDDWTYFELEN